MTLDNPGTNDGIDGTEFDPVRHVARGGAISGLGAVVAAIGGSLLTLVVARSYDREVAGIFFAATAFFTIASSITLLGTDVGLVRYVSAQHAGGTRASTTLLRIALLPVLAVGVACSAALWVAAPAVANWIGSTAVDEEATGILRTLAPFVPVVSLHSALLAVTQGRGRMRHTVLVDSVFRTLSQPAAIAIVAAAGFGPLVAALAWVLPYLFGAVYSSLVVLPQRHRSGDWAEPGRADLSRDFWRFTSGRAMAGIVIMVWRRFDILLVAAISGPADAAVYTAATRFLIVGRLGIQAVQMAVSPQLGRLFATGDLAGARRVYATSTMWTMLFGWPLYIVTAVAAPYVIPVFGSGYDAGTSAVIVLSSAMLVSTACGGVDSVLLMAGRSVLSLGIAIATLAANVVFDIVLIPRHGILGAAIGWACSIVLRNVLTLWQAQGILGTSMVGRRIGMIAGAAVACFAVVPVMLAASDVPDMWLAPALAVGSICYVVWAWVRRRTLELDTFGRALRRRAVTSAT